MQAKLTEDFDHRSGLTLEKGAPVDVITKDPERQSTVACRIGGTNLLIQIPVELLKFDKKA